MTTIKELVAMKLALEACKRNQSAQAQAILEEALAEKDVVLDLEPEVLAKLESDLANQATISSGLCGGCAKKAADGWALYCVECWEKAEQEPVAEILVNDKDVIVLWHKTARQLGHQVKLYAAPVRTKDLTDDEVAKAYMECTGGDIIARFRAVIAADREKNK